jgi:osmotically-inducible protein OsmY
MKYISLISILILLTSCVEGIIVAGTIGARIALREKTFDNTKNDLNIGYETVKKFSLAKLKVPGNSINILVNERRVLLTGIVSDYEMVKKAKKLAWEVQGVKEVINEIQVAKNKSQFNGFRIFAKDLIITSQINARSLIKKDVSTLNVKINTVNSTVYLFGVAQNQIEIDRITRLVAKTKGVKKVVSHIIEINDPRRI